MFYYLFQYLKTLGFPGAGVFTYVTFRAVAAAIVALVVSVIFGKYFIRRMQRKKLSNAMNVLVGMDILGHTLHWET